MTVYLVKPQAFWAKQWTGPDGWEQSELFGWLAAHPEYQWRLQDPDPAVPALRNVYDSEDTDRPEPEKFLFVTGPKRGNLACLGPGEWLTIDSLGRLRTLSEWYMGKSVIPDNDRIGAWIETALIMADPDLRRDLEESLGQMARGEGEPVDPNELLRIAESLVDEAF